MKEDTNLMGNGTFVETYNSLRSITPTLARHPDEPKVTQKSNSSNHRHNQPQINICYVLIQIKVLHFSANVPSDASSRCLSSQTACSTTSLTRLLMQNPDPSDVTDADISISLPLHAATLVFNHLASSVSATLITYIFFSVFLRATPRGTFRLTTDQVTASAKRVHLSDKDEQEGRLDAKTHTHTHTAGQKQMSQPALRGEEKQRHILPALLWGGGVTLHRGVVHSPCGN